MRARWSGSRSLLNLACPRCGAVIEQQGDAIPCRSCGTVFPILDGIPSLTKAAQDDPSVKQFFDRVGQEMHDGKLSYVPFDAPQLDRQLQVLSHAYIRAVERWIPHGSLVLDVGCGHGALLEAAIPNYKMAGVDFVMEMLPPAQKRGYDVYQGDATALPFQAAQFDAVICAEVLQHFPDPRQILCELARVCRPGGRILISTLNRRSIARWLARNMARVLHPSAFPLPIIRRSARDIVLDAAEFSLTLVDAAWVLSPSTAVAYDRHAGSILAPFATNFILCLQKAAEGQAL